MQRRSSFSHFEESRSMQRRSSLGSLHEPSSTMQRKSSVVQLQESEDVPHYMLPRRLSYQKLEPSRVQRRSSHDSLHAHVAEPSLSHKWQVVDECLHRPRREKLRQFCNRWNGEHQSCDGGLTPHKLHVYEHDLNEWHKYWTRDAERGCVGH